MKTSLICYLIFTLLQGPLAYARDMQGSSGTDSDSSKIISRECLIFDKNAEALGIVSAPSGRKTILGDWVPGNQEQAFHAFAVLKSYPGTPQHTLDTYAVLSSRPNIKTDEEAKALVEKLVESEFCSSQAYYTLLNGLTEFSLKGKSETLREPVLEAAKHFLGASEDAPVDSFLSLNTRMALLSKLIKSKVITLKPKSLVKDLEKLKMETKKAAQSVGQKVQKKDGWIAHYKALVYEREELSKLIKKYSVIAQNLE